MQPVVIIPTFIAGRRHRPGSNAIATYDHVTPLGDPGELGRCLASLEKVRGLGLVVVLVAAESMVQSPSSPASRTRCPMIDWAMVERQMFPWQTNRTETGARLAKACSF